ncbi:MAG: alcohol dehydrogenase catalytic domain-containing protein [Dehalococcoidia bacterium]
MQALSFPGYGRVEIIEIPRPSLRDPGDAIVLVTTAAIGPWDIERFLSVGEGAVIPGGEFAGIVVETGETVTTIELDDLVANTVQHTTAEGRSSLFGSTTLPGGHAEYVRVPDADKTLTKIADSGEERAVIAGGTIGLGVNAAALATSVSPQGTYAVVGCDPIGMTALIALGNTVATDRLLAVEDHPARRTLASKYSNAALSGTQSPTSHGFDVVIVGSTREYPGFEAVANLVKPDGRVIFAEPYGPDRVVEAGDEIPAGLTVSTASWPTNVEAKKIVIALQIRRLDLTPLVSHVIPLDQAQDAYEAAAGPGPGVQKVLLKP